MQEKTMDQQINEALSSRDLIDIKRLILKGTTEIRQATLKGYSLADEEAKAEKEYRIALSQELLRLKSEGVAMSIINDVARGNLAELKLKRDLAEGIAKANRDHIRGLMAQLSALQSILRTQEDI